MTAGAQSQQKNNLMVVLGLVLLLVPVIIWGLWIHIFNSNPSASQAEKVKIFTSYFPGFLQSISSISIIVLVSGAASILFIVAGRKKANRIWRAIGIVIIIVSALILLLQLFSML